MTRYIHWAVQRPSGYMSPYTFRMVWKAADVRRYSKPTQPVFVAFYRGWKPAAEIRWFRVRNGGKS